MASAGEDTLATVFALEEEVAGVAAVARHLRATWPKFLLAVAWSELAFREKDEHKYLLKRCAWRVWQSQGKARLGRESEMRRS